MSDVRLHVIRRDGSRAVPFLLVHGLASNARMWDGVGDALAVKGYRSVAVDQRGHGQSEKPDDGYDMDTFVADLMRVIADERLDRPVVVGQSWGGNVAVELGRRHPDLVRGVVGVDGGAIELRRRFPDWDACWEVLAPPPLAGTPVEDIEAWSRQVHHDWPESGLNGSLASFEVLEDGTIRPWLSLDHHMRILGSLWEHEPSTIWPEMKVPLLFLTASEHMREGVDEAIRLAPNARGTWFAGADHDLHAQRPEQVATVLANAVDAGFFG